MSILLIKLGQHGLIFIFAKSAVLLAPLLAAAVLSRSLYGTVEWWISLSIALGPLVSMGAPGIIAYGTVGQQFRKYVTSAIVYVMGAAGALITISLFAPLLGVSWQEHFIGPVALQCALVILQLALSARLKGLGKGAWASLIESSLYLSFLIALILKLQGLNFINAFAFCMLISSVLIMFGLYRSISEKGSTGWKKFNFRGFFKAGVPFLIGGALMGGFIALPRITLGMFSISERVAEFALAFRWLSIAIVAHQFINTVFFRKIFSNVGHESRDKLLALSVSIVASGSLVILVFLFAADHGGYPIPLPKSLDVSWWVSLCIIMWAGSASFEGVLYREAAAFSQVRAVAVGLTGQLIFTAFIVFYLHEDLYLQGIAIAWTLSFVVLSLMQCLALRQAGISMPRLSKVLIGIFCFYVSVGISQL